MKLETMGAILGVGVICAFGIWLQYFAPCSWHKGGTLTTVPVRCVEIKK